MLTFLPKAFCFVGKKEGKADSQHALAKDLGS